MKVLFVILGCLSFGVVVSAQEPPNPSRDTQASLKKIGNELAAAQKAEDEREVQRLAKKAIEALGDQAGMPEIADQFREVPKTAKPLTPEELPNAFDRYIDFIEKQK
ncbi:MAG: hypothetical protein JNL18_06335 [Planctomycetaceae bacterium]|nr:hypothetical protein [Planctomycetaceae bacterium]